VIRLTRHAAERMRQYGIPGEWVEATIEQPAWTQADPFQPGVTRSFREIAQREGRILRVAHRQAGDDVLVLSAHFDRGAKR
jgi:Domain of unknown function (DUF4258)